MRKHVFYAAVFAALVASATLTTTNAQYLLATHKKFYEPTDSIEFYYIYPTKHSWSSLWLTVEPLNKGNHLNAAADLGEPGKGWQVYHASRFGTGKFRATLTAMTDHKGTVMVESEFEIRKERKTYQVGTIALEDDEQKGRLSALKKIVKEKTGPYDVALQKYNTVAGRLAQIKQQMDKLQVEKDKLQSKMERAARKISEDEARRARVKEIRGLFTTGPMGEAQVRKITSERDSLQKIIDDRSGDIRAAQTELGNYTKAIQPVMAEIKRLGGQPLASISKEIEEAKTELKKASEELRLAEVKYYENKSMSTVEEIKITSGANIVYHAKWNWTPDQLLNQLLHDLKADSATAAAAKKKAFDAFYAACKEEVAAGNKLVGLGGEIWKAFYKTATIEALFHTFDLTRAWYRGGPASFLWEAVKKLAWVYGKQVIWPEQPFLPGSVEAEFFHEYENIANNPYPSAYELTANANLVLENKKTTDWELTAGKVGWDARAWILEKITAKIALAKRATEIAGVTAQVMDHTAKIDMGVNIAKDLVKTALLSWAKSGEEKAWVDYILKARHARLLYAPYAIAANHYWKVDSLYHEVLAKYSAYVSNTEPPTKEPFKVLVNENFYEDDDLQMVIKLRTETPGFKDRIVIGGSEAFYKSPHHFTKAIGPQLSEESPGKLKLNLFLFKTPMNGWNPTSYQQ